MKNYGTHNQQGTQNPTNEKLEVHVVQHALNEFPNIAAGLHMEDVVITNPYKTQPTTSIEVNTNKIKYISISIKVDFFNTL